MPREVILKPHKKQQEFITSPAKFRAFIAGIGSGKTLVGCAEMIMHCAGNPGSLNMVVAPTYRMLADTTRRTFLELCEDKVKYEFKKGSNEIIFPNKATVLFRSADEPEKLRGPTLSAFYGDEASIWDFMVWKILIGRLRQHGQPQRAWITATPKGFNWIYREFVEKERPDYAIIQCSSRENPYLGAEYVPMLEESYSDSNFFAKQEIEGKFMAHEGLVYMNFSRFTHVIDTEFIKENGLKGIITKKQKKFFKSIIAGVDFGFTNPMVCVVIGLDSDGRAYILDEFYQRKTTIDVFIEICNEFKQKYGIEVFYCDPSEPMLIQQMNNEGLYSEPANNEVIPGIQKVYSYLEIKDDKLPRMFINKKCIHTIKEFEQYSYADKKENKPERDVPVKVHDHLMDGIRYSLASLDIGEMVLLPDSEGFF